MVSKEDSEDSFWNVYDKCPPGYPLKMLLMENLYNAFSLSHKQENTKQYYRNS